MVSSYLFTTKQVQSTQQRQKACSLREGRHSSQLSPAAAKGLQTVQRHHNSQSLRNSLIPPLKKQKNEALSVVGLECALTDDVSADRDSLLLGLQLIPKLQLCTRGSNSWVIQPVTS